MGDISLQAEYWLSDPASSSPITGSVNLGIKAPTGADALQGTYANGAVVPIDETFQMGNGGWELLLRAQGQAHISGPFAAYASGYYGFSLTEHTNVMHHGTVRRPGRASRRPRYLLRPRWEWPTCFRSSRGWS